MIPVRLRSKEICEYAVREWPDYMDDVPEKIRQQIGI